MLLKFAAGLAWEKTKLMLLLIILVFICSSVKDVGKPSFALTWLGRDIKLLKSACEHGWMGTRRTEKLMGTEKTKTSMFVFRAI